MRTNSRFSQNVYTISDRIWCNKHLRHTTTEKWKQWERWIRLIWLRSNDTHIRAILQEMPQPSITKIHLKSTYLKFHSNFPGANELMKNIVVFVATINALHAPSHVLSIPSQHCEKGSYFTCKGVRQRWFLLLILINSSPLDKMAAFSQMIFSDALLWMTSFCNLIKISLKFVPKGPIDNNPTLV